MEDKYELPPSRTPSPSFASAQRRRATTASPYEQSRWSASTLSSGAPSILPSISYSAHKSLPPLPTGRGESIISQQAARPRTVIDRPPRHERNRSAPSAWRPVTAGSVSRTPSQASFARTLSSSSREIPIMLQIDEDAPPVPAIPEREELPPPRSPMSEVNLSSPVSKAPSTPPKGNAIRRTSIAAPSIAPSAPQSAPLDGSPGGHRRLRSKYFVDDSLSRTRSAATSLMPSPHPGGSARASPLSSSRTVNGPPSSYRQPQPSMAEDSVHQTDSRPATSASNSSSLMDRVGTRIRKSLRNPARYQKLDDETQPAIPMNRMGEDHGPAITAEGEYIPIAFDISTFEGPAQLQARPSTKQQRQHVQRSSSQGVSDDADILESKGQLTGGLGGGMDDVLEAQINMPLGYRPTKIVRPDYRPSLAKRTASRFRVKRPPSPNIMTQAGQEAADKSGHVVAIDEEFVDLSNVEGGMGGTDTPKDIDDLAEDALKQSYYFPPDPQMPNWRPLPMQPWYLILLIGIAITFFVLSEHLVRVSGPPDSGKGLITFEHPSEVPNSLWFVWKYLGEILMVSYGVMFQATDFEVRRLEPYYQMSRPTGAMAAESLNMDYLTFWSYLIPFKAFRHRQWAVVCSSLSTIMASAIMPVLYSAAVNLNPPRDERTVKPGDPPIQFKVQMDPVWSRLMEATLLLIIISTGLLLFQQRRKSGLTGDLKGIAGIATMATKSHILNDFKGLDPAPHSVIHKQLAHRRYILHKGSLWQGEYIARLDDRDEVAMKPKNPHPVALHLPVGFIFMFSLLLFAGLIPIIEFNEGANQITDAAPWFLPLLATLLKLAWTNLETGIRMIEPFYHLSCRHAPPSVLLLDYTGTIPGAMPVKAFLNRHFLLGAIGIGSLLGEVLTVCVSSFNVDGHDFLSGAQKQENNSGETRRTFFISLALAEGIPAVLMIMLIFVYWRRRHAFLPRQPGTIASVLAFVHQSKMLWDFVKEENDEAEGNSPTSHYNTRRNTIAQKPLKKSKTLATFKSAGYFLASEKDQQTDIAERAVRNMELDKKTYGLGWYRGRDGQDHVGVDQEELLHSYQHGIDFTKSHMGADIGRWEHL